MQCHYIVVAMMNRDEAEAARHAAFLDKQERVFHKRQQVIWRCIAFSTTPMVGHKDDSLAGSRLIMGVGLNFESYQVVPVCTNVF